MWLQGPQPLEPLKRWNMGMSGQERFHMARTAPDLLPPSSSSASLGGPIPGEILDAQG